jgi:hypothetical protein
LDGQNPQFPQIDKSVDVKRCAECGGHLKIALAGSAREKRSQLISRTGESFAFERSFKCNFQCVQVEDGARREMAVGSIHLLALHVEWKRELA